MLMVKFKAKKNSSQMPYDEEYGLESIYYKEQYTHNGVHYSVYRAADIKYFSIEEIGNETTRRN